MENLLVFSLPNCSRLFWNVKVLSVSLLALLLKLDLSNMIRFLLIFKLTFLEKPHLAEFRPTEIIKTGHKVVEKRIKMFKYLLVTLVKL